jgi:hypothetical protein
MCMALTLALWRVLLLAGSSTVLTRTVEDPLVLTTLDLIVTRWRRHRALYQELGPLLRPPARP